MFDGLVSMLFIISHCRLAQDSNVYCEERGLQITGQINLLCFFILSFCFILHTAQPAYKLKKLASEFVSSIVFTRYMYDELSPFPEVRQLPRKKNSEMKVSLQKKSLNKKNTTALTQIYHRWCKRTLRIAEIIKKDYHFVYIRQFHRYKRNIVALKSTLLLLHSIFRQVEKGLHHLLYYITNF